MESTGMTVFCAFNPAELIVMGKKKKQKKTQKKPDKKNMLRTPKFLSVQRSLLGG